MIHYKLDPSTTGVLGVCREPGCGTRNLASTREEAIRQRSDHEERAHLKNGRIATRRTPIRTK